VSFARQLRTHRLRPRCQACSGVRGRPTIQIDHPPGAELQWDWFERRRAPWGGTAYVLLGSLPRSGRIRGVLAEATDQPHLVEAIDGVLRRFGGTARTWRTDRLATVIVPGTRDVQPSFVPVAKHYGVVVEPCPPRRANRKGSVESAVRFVCGRWWRTMTATTMAEAQGSLDRFLATVGDARPRPWPDGNTAGRTTVGALADAEPLLALPAAPYPATVEVGRPVDTDATVAFGGNRYSVPPGLIGSQLVLRHRLGTATLEVSSAAGSLLATHRLAPAGAGQLVRTPQHRAALEGVVLGAFSTARPCRRKGNHPPGPAALAEAARLLGPAGREVTVDLGRYAELVGGVVGGADLAARPPTANPPSGWEAPDEPGLDLPAPAWPPGRVAHDRRGRGPAASARACCRRWHQPHRVPGGAARGRGGRRRSQAPGIPGPLRLPASTLADRRLRLRRPTLGRP
jgi:hypothetical protein